MEPLKSASTDAFRKVTLAILLIAAFGGVVHAVDGILSNGGRSSSKSSYSNLKKDYKMSLRSGFTFQDNRNFGSPKVVAKGDLNSVISLQKGNVTLYLPTRTKSLIHRFRTPSAPVVR